VAPCSSAWFPSHSSHGAGGGGSLGAHCWYVVIIERRVVAGRRVLAGKMGKRQEADGLGERGVTAEALQG
jgi:hypothetical protein